MLRLLLFSVILSVVSTGLAQKNIPINWETSDYQLDSSHLLYYPLQIRRLDGLTLHHQSSSIAGGKIEPHFDLEEVEWVASSTDTLIRKFWLDEQLYTGQLLQRGTVKLYRIIESNAPFPFVLRHQEKDYSLDAENAKSVGYEIIRANCQFFQPPKKLYSDVGFMLLTQQINQCLSGDKGQAVHTYSPTRFRAGLGTHILIERVINDLDDRPSFNKENFALTMPRVSAIFTWLPFRQLPWLVQETQLRSLNFSRQRIWISGEMARANESFRVDNLYLYPGINIETGNRAPLQLFAGGGLSLVVPLRFKRVLDFSDPNATLPGRPIYQLIRKGQAPKLGYYFQLGFRVRVAADYSIGITFREEDLVQTFRYWQEEVLYSNYLPRKEDLAVRKHHYLQLEMLYHW